MKYTRVIVQGKVQGVWFRDHTRSMARKLGLTGWVRNLASGEVETVFAGPPDKVAEMLTWLQQGSPLARVDQLIESEHYDQELYSFEIRY